MDDELIEIRQALRRVHLFSDVLSHDQLAELAGHCSPFFFRAGSTLMRQGDFGATMFCITDGVVAVTYVDELDRTNDIRQLGSGSVVGEIEMMTGERRVATVTAVSNVRVLQIARPALQALFEKAPDLVESFGATLATRMAMLQQLVPERRGSLKAKLVRQIRGVLLKKGSRQSPAA